MLEQNDLLKTETANLKERSLAEQKVILSLQDEIKRLKILLAAENVNIYLSLIRYPIERKRQVERCRRKVKEITYKNI